MRLDGLHRFIPPWDEYNWDEQTQCGTFTREIEHPNGDVEEVPVDSAYQPNPVITGKPIVHTDRHGHKIALGYVEGIRTPIAYPGRPPMGRILYYAE
jgi:hypothetical protein